MILKIEPRKKLNASNKHTLDGKRISKKRAVHLISGLTPSRVEVSGVIWYDLPNPLKVTHPQP